MTSLLIIGGSGFLGKSFLDSRKRNLLAPLNINKIFILSRNASRLKKTNPDLINKDVELIDADITKCKKIPYSEYVIHAAASTDIKKYLISDNSEKNNIVKAVINYSELVKNFHKKSKILYISSGAVYGVQPENLLKIPESYICGNIFPDSCSHKRDYALAKQESEKIILKLAQDGCSVAIARCFAFVGPHLPLNQHFAIGNFILDGLMGRSINVNSTQHVYRSYMYADDMVEWLIYLLQKASTHCPVYNVGSDQEISIIDLAQKVGTYFSVNVKFPLQKSNSIDRYIPSIELAKNTGLSLKNDLDAAILKTVKNLKNSSILLKNLK